MALREQPYIPLYVQDFISDERLRECSAESVGVYIMLMCVLHKQKEYGKLLLLQKYNKTPNKISNFAIKLSLHLPFDAATIERALGELLEEEVVQIEGDALVQKRMVKDGELSNKRASAGKKGMGERYSNNKKEEVVTDFVITKTITNSENEIEYENEVEIENKNENIHTSGIEIFSESENSVPEKTKPRNILSSQQQVFFDRFYSAYPKKVDRATAERAWAKISPKPDEAMTEKIVQAVENSQKYDSRFKDRQYIPNPASWINAKGYLNEFTPSKDKPPDIGGKDYSGSFYDG